MNPKQIIFICLFVLHGLGLTSLSAVDFKTKQPNIIVIMADDLGYGDVSAYGATEIQSPHIDRLA